jgi:hypothetical protein
MLIGLSLAVLFLSAGFCSSGGGDDDGGGAIDANGSISANMSGGTPAGNLTMQNETLMLLCNQSGAIQTSFVFNQTPSLAGFNYDYSYRVGPCMNGSFDVLLKDNESMYNVRAEDVAFMQYVWMEGNGSLSSDVDYVQVCVNITEENASSAILRCSS